MRRKRKRKRRRRRRRRRRRMRRKRKRKKRRRRRRRRKRKRKRKKRRRRGAIGICDVDGKRELNLCFHVYVCQWSVSCIVNYVPQKERERVYECTPGRLGFELSK
jgi:hypothetical protein